MMDPYIFLIVQEYASLFCILTAIVLTGAAHAGIEKEVFTDRLGTAFARVGSFLLILSILELIYLITFT